MPEPEEAEIQMEEGMIKDIDRMLPISQHPMIHEEEVETSDSSNEFSNINEELQFHLNGGSDQKTVPEKKIVIIPSLILF